MLNKLQVGLINRLSLDYNCSVKDTMVKVLAVEQDIHDRNIGDRFDLRKSYFYSAIARVSEDYKR